jgi:glycosyltransferase involved in cell wall biosynthesis
VRRRSDVVVGSPLVVACVATWNGESFIKDALASLAAQTHPNLRVLVSDDASTDGTAAICEGFARSDPRFSFARQPERLGWIGNVNALLRAARGDYLFLVSHDDVVEPTYVARLVDALENRPAAVLAYSDMAFIDLNGTAEIQRYLDLDRVEARRSRVYRMLRHRGPWWIPYRGVFRADAVMHIEGLRPHLAGEFSADWPWLVHMALLGEFVRVPEVLYRRIQRPQSLSRVWSFTEWAWLAVTLAAVGEIRRSRLSLVEKVGLCMPVALAFLHWAPKGVWFYLRMRWRPVKGR